MSKSRAVTARPYQARAARYGALVLGAFMACQPDRSPERVLDGLREEHTGQKGPFIV